MELQIDRLAVLPVMDFLVAIRADRSDPARLVRSLVGQPLGVVGFKVRFAGSSVEPCTFPARVADAGSARHDVLPHRRNALAIGRFGFTLRLFSPTLRRSHRALTKF